MSEDTPQLNIKVIKRLGETVDFHPNKIEVALLKCYSSPGVFGAEAGQSTSIREKVSAIAATVVEQIANSGRGSIRIEEIQDLVENALMDAKEHVAAREYIFFRRMRNNERQRAAAEQQKLEATFLRIKQADGTETGLDPATVLKTIQEAAEGLTGIDVELVCDQAIGNLYNGATVQEVDQALELAARQYIETEPNYSFLAARLNLFKVRRIACRHLGVANQNDYGAIFVKGLDLGVKLNMFSPKLVSGLFNLDKLAGALDSKRDFQFDYLGFDTLYDRYFSHEKKVRFELPQTMLMRVAMGLSMNETDPTESAIELYNKYSSFDAMPSTPTLFNSGMIRSQLSSCFLTQVPDDLHGIFMAIHDNAMLSKFSGGIGNDWTPVRSTNARIAGTNGKSQGTVPFLKVANDTAIAVNQGGKRKGAVCAFLETWHADIEDFIELRKNTGDDRRRTHDMDTANWIPDLFMERMLEGKDWSLFSPEEVPELHELYGRAFKAKYEEYERLGEDGKLAVYKKVPAITLWRKMLAMLFETGHPWLTWKDPCNIRSPQQHCGVVHSSNLCTEITLNTKAGYEIAVCNLASVNVPAHLVLVDGVYAIDMKKLEETVRVVMRGLDNTIEGNYYTVKEAEDSNLRHRPVGLGIMGFHDALLMQGIPYESMEAVYFADEFQEALSYFAIKASADMARTRGSYESFEGSLWSKGILPIDSIQMLKDARDYAVDMDTSSRLNLDWAGLREYVKGGMRNSNCMAIAPTATISNIIGVSQSVDPIYQNLFVKSNMSGNYTVVNKIMVDKLKALDLWDSVMVQDLKYYDGSVQKIERIPAELRRLFSTSFEIPPLSLIQCGSRRQKWIDQAQSLNLYMAAPSGKLLDSTYKAAWASGLKTTYYLRSLGATATEKTTIMDSRLNQVVAVPEPPKPNVSTVGDDVQLQGKACPIDAGPGCEACQ